MSEIDEGHRAGRESPNAYLARRPAEYDCPRQPRAEYVTMRDGCRLAVDFYVPRRRDGLNTRAYYTDWQGRNARMLCYTGAPLEREVEVSGYPVVTL